MARRLLAALVALVIPPLGVLLGRGMGLAFLANAALWVIALVVYFGFYAGPGLALYGLAALSGVVLALFGRGAKRTAAAA